MSLAGVQHPASSALILGRSVGPAYLDYIASIRQIGHPILLSILIISGREKWWIHTPLHYILRCLVLTLCYPYAEPSQALKNYRQRIPTLGAQHRAACIHRPNNQVSYEITLHIIFSQFWP